MTSVNETTVRPSYRRKLIEIDLPLNAINVESAREKSIRRGHPSTLHPWWARRPLASCRAVIFASMVDDPIDCHEEFDTEEKQSAERQRLHGLIQRFVKWENVAEGNPQNEDLWAEVRWEIARSVARSYKESPPDKADKAAVFEYLKDKAMPVYDPFCGGGSIPLETQRLGLKAVGSDLNPVAVLITKALIELPGTHRGQPPINASADKTGIPTGRKNTAERIPWSGTKGLANDIRYYGLWMRGKAWHEVGHLYPTATTPEGNEVTVTTWLWARTAPCANPACGAPMPLLKTFQLSKKRGKEWWTKPSFDPEIKEVTFTVQRSQEGIPEQGTADGQKGTTCVICNSVRPPSYIREQGRAGNLTQVMTGIVAEGKKERVFLSPDATHITASEVSEPDWKPVGDMPIKARSISIQTYGFTTWSSLFTNRQLQTLTTFCDLLQELDQKLEEDESTKEYADTIRTYMALAISKLAHGCCTFNRWRNDAHKVEGVFARQGIGMIWDFAETNPFSNTTQNWLAQVEWIAQVIEALPVRANEGKTYQADAANTIHAEKGPVIVTDPPYYDNIHYADASDFFYVWLRPTLRDTYSDLFSGIRVPKQEEMIASRFRFDHPREHFETQLNKTLSLIREQCSAEFPASIFYAYKQQEEEREGRLSTGWEMMLRALVNAGFQITGTWPMRTEMSTRANSFEANSLASSVILVCRPRSENAQPATRREFLNALDDELPKALDQLTHEGHIAPVDLAQAAIGPGMQIYSRYSRVEAISGEQVTVREALAAINQVIANYDERQEGEFDRPTSFCLSWLRQYGYEQGPYGQAEILAVAKDVAIDSLRDTHGLLSAHEGNVQLRQPGHFSADYIPSQGQITAWEGCFRMAWHFDHEDGTLNGAADIGRGMGSDVESVERLARILYNHFDRINDSRRAVLFNNLVTSWDDIQNEMNKTPQGRMDLL